MLLVLLNSYHLLPSPSPVWDCCLLLFVVWLSVVWYSVIRSYLHQLVSTHAYGDDELSKDLFSQPLLLKFMQPVFIVMIIRMEIVNDNDDYKELRGRNL